jgi:hypothetical protein
VASLRETIMARVVGSKGKEGRRKSGALMEGRGAQGLFIGAKNGELGRRWWW